MESSKKLNIVMADDDEDDREMFKDALISVNRNVRFTVVSNGVKLMELLQKIQDNLPDIIFLDLNMPLKGGMECVHEIKNSKIFARVPIAIYSTSCFIDHIEATYEKGADLYIQKPSSFSGIQTVIRKVFERDLDSLVLNRSKTNFLIT
jgi:CheY-like chemotaxis protein